MRIRKIHIEEYGALRERDFSLSDGINLFEGRNESGKSTVLSFIRFLLYGLPRRSSGETVGERQRGLSWQNGVAAGSMEVIKDRKSYRIERRSQLREGGSLAETCKIFDTETGAEVFHGENPGKVFLGIPAEVFTGTACVRQLECTEMNSDEINSSIENLLFSADEEIDTAKVQGKLDDLRRTLLYKNGKGGRLFELETTKDLLETKLKTAMQNAETMIAKEAAVERLKTVSEKAKKQAEEAEEQIRIYETATALKRFETLHSYEKQYADCEKDLEKLVREKGYRDALPDRETLGAIERFAATLNDAARNRESAETALHRAENSPCGDRGLAAFYARTDEEGGKETICAAFLTAVKKQKHAILRAVLFFVFGGILLGGGTLSLLSDFFAAYYSSVPYFPYCLLGGGTLLAGLGIFSLISAGKSKKKKIALVDKIGVSAPSSVTGESLAAHIENCRKNHELCEQYDTALLKAKKNYDESTTALEKSIDSTARMLSSVGVGTPAENTTETLSALLRSTHTAFLATCTEKEKIEGKLDSLRALIDELRENLKGSNEASLSAAMGKRAPASVLASADIEKTRLAYNYSKTQHTLNEQKKIALEKELIALNSTSENPAKLAAKLAEVTAELNVKRAKYNALVMAYETLGTASENLRQNVTPRLRVRAGEIMEKLTGGRYRDLGITPDMKITVLFDHVTRPIDAMSKGTRDAAYLALRMALAELICENNMPPLLFDESFTQLDDIRTESMLNMLFGYTADGAQTLIFTCHKREGEMLRRIGNFNHILLNK